MLIALQVRFDLARVVERDKAAELLKLLHVGQAGEGREVDGAVPAAVAVEADNHLKGHAGLEALVDRVTKGRPGNKHRAPRIRALDLHPVHHVTYDNAGEGLRTGRDLVLCGHGISPADCYGATKLHIL